MANGKPTPGQKLFKRLRDLHAHTIDPANSAETKKSFQDQLDKEIARDEITRHGKKTMDDLAALLDRAQRLGIEDASDWLGQPLPGAAGAGSYTSMDMGDDAPLQLVYTALRKWTYMGEPEYVAVTLWILHTFVYDFFQHTPRLLTSSPINGCGKSTLMDLVSRMSANAIKRGSVSDASVWHKIDTQQPAPLIVDNGEHLKIEGPLLTVFDEGYEMEGCREQFWDGQLRTFKLFGPLAIAGVVRDPAQLPMSLVTRSIQINMTLDTVGHVSEDQRFKKLSPQHIQFLDLARNYAREWAVKVRSGEIVLNPDPPMPHRLRIANNWRVLFAIADAFGAGWGERTRAAAVALERERMLIDPGLLMLRDIREAFNSGEGTFINGAGVKTFSSLVLAKLLAQNPPWDSWTGLKGKEAPHELRQGDLAAILRAFGIRPRKQWPRNRRKDSKSCNGYAEDQFESTFKIYCPDGAEARPSPLAKLFGVTS